MDASTANSEGFTALVMAAEGGHIEVAALLIAGGADQGRSANDACPLVRAAGRGHLSMVAELLRAGADVEDREDGCPAIVIAARHGHDEVMLIKLWCPSRALRYRLTGSWLVSGGSDAGRREG